VTETGSGAVIESIDASRKTATKTIGGFPDFVYYPITLSGNEAEIPLSGLAYGKSYAVSIDADVFPGASGLPGASGGAPPLRFSTRAAAPAARAARLTVAADGSGDFCTVQGAIDFVPAGNTSPVTLFIKKGFYPEIIAFAEKNAITLIGEDRKQTVIAYATNARFNPGGGNPFAGPSPNPSAQKSGAHIYHRGVFLGHRVQDLTIANLTLRNTTPQGGSQAEAIILNGTTQARAILRNVDLYSFQDTLQINGQAYIADSYIEGDVDFMWGTGPCFFENCVCRALRSDAYYTQIRNPQTNHGFVYSHCIFDGSRGVVGNYLSRIDPGRFPASEVVLIDCTLGPSVGSTAWRFDVTKEGPKVHFWEFASHAADGKPVDTQLRLPASRQLQQPDDAALIAQYSDPTFVLGHGWNPKLAR
jgi:pectin methylesterase-like acyl-CoA thioesterase